MLASARSQEMAKLGMDSFRHFMWPSFFMTRNYRGKKLTTFREQKWPINISVLWEWPKRWTSFWTVSSSGQEDIWPLFQFLVSIHCLFFFSYIFPFYSNFSIPQYFFLFYSILYSSFFLLYILITILFCPLYFFFCFFFIFYFYFSMS